MINNLIVAIALMFAIGTPQSKASKLDWLRHSVEGANCAAAFLDVASTRQGISVGAVETNSLLTTAGKINYGRLYAVKAAGCVAPIIWNEFAHRYWKSRTIDLENTLGTGVWAGYQGFVVGHNYQVINQPGFKATRVSGGSKKFFIPSSVVGLMANNLPERLDPRCASGVSSSRSYRDSPLEPTEPCLHARADENLKWISELEHRLGRIDAHMFGERPEDANKRLPCADSLEAKLADAGTRSACLVSQASGILGKLTGNPG